MSSLSPTRAGRLPHLGALRFSGPDCLGFLQGQLSNDTRRLAEKQSLFAAYSSPQGRVLALMHLLPHSSGVVAILPRELILQTSESLRKFVLRAKVKIEDAGELSVAGLHDAAQLETFGSTAPRPDPATPGSAAHPAGTGYLESEGIGVAAVNGDPGRYWVIGAQEKLAERGLDSDGPRVERDWRLADIRAGLPQIYLATREAFVAQMLNLDLLGGISFSKGCYTGQEIIARTQHLGRIKRRLYRLRLPEGAWQIGQALRLTDGRAGRLTEVIHGEDGWEALAVLNREAGAAEGGRAADSADGGPAAGSAAAAGVDAPIAAAALPLPYSV